MRLDLAQEDETVQEYQTQTMEERHQMRVLSVKSDEEVPFLEVLADKERWTAEEVQEYDLDLAR